MKKIIGLDIGTTSVGFAVITYDADKSEGQILQLGARIFPEAIEQKKGATLNQERREARLRRRNLRQRRTRKETLAKALADAKLLPTADTSDPQWRKTMESDPYDLRVNAVTGKALSAHELGRALYHLAQRRQFKAKEDLEETEKKDKSKSEKKDDDKEKKENEEKAAKAESMSTHAILKEKGITFAQYLKELPEGERRRKQRALRRDIAAEFEKIWAAQAPKLQLDDKLKENLHDAIFSQRLVFWRKNTLGVCRFFPNEKPCHSSSWLAQQRVMLENLNNLKIDTGNRAGDKLMPDERAAILAKLQTQKSMKFGRVREVLKATGLPADTKFNLEQDSDKELPGNKVEAKLAKIFGASWENHPQQQRLRDEIPARVWAMNYDASMKQRVVIRNEDDRKKKKDELRKELENDYGITAEEAEQLSGIKFKQSWEPYSIKALESFLPELEKGTSFGEMLNGPAFAQWRAQTFPDMDGPTGEILDRLPTPQDRDEVGFFHRKNVRNPAVMRVHNEMRKVVNNLIVRHGKPDEIHVEWTREAGKSKKVRKEIEDGMEAQRDKRDKARKALKERGIAEPSPDQIEKYLLWKECGKHCPYTGKPICFTALFVAGEFEIEHIWPRKRSADNSYRNKTLCHKSENQRKSNRMPREYLSDDKLDEVLERLEIMHKNHGMSKGKIARFKAKEIPKGFSERDLRVTGHASKLAVESLKRLWADTGDEKLTPNLLPVPGQLAAKLRDGWRSWGLNNILSADGKKTRENHKHHAIDALVVACINSSIIQRQQRFQKEGGRKPKFPLPWKTIYEDAKAACDAVVVSHRVRKKVSGALHKETFYGDSGKTEGKKDEYRLFVRRQAIENFKLTAKSKLNVENIRDKTVAQAVREYLEEKARIEEENKTRHKEDRLDLPDHPLVNPDNPEKSAVIKKARYEFPQEPAGMIKLKSGYVDKGRNHHIAIFRDANGKVLTDIVSLYEAAQRLRKKEPIIRRTHSENADAKFVMSLSLGDAVQFPEDAAVPGKKIKIVKKIRSSGEITLDDHDDAIPLKDKKEWRRSANTILKKYNAKKISIDPIGRIRKAGD